jgi:hypothetical protein
VGLRGRLNRLEREARGDLVRVDQRDGRVLYFERMEVLKAMFLRSYAAVGRPPEPSAVMEALENATPASRRALEEELGTAGTFYDLEPHDPTAGPVEDLSE